MTASTGDGRGGSLMSDAAIGESRGSADNDDVLQEVVFSPIMSPAQASKYSRRVL